MISRERVVMIVVINEQRERERERGKWCIKALSAA